MFFYQYMMFKKVASNTFSQIFAKMLTAFISIFLLWILTNYLSTELFWQYNKVYNYLAFFAFFADLGLYTIAIREISKDESKASYILWNMLSLRLILWTSVIILAWWIAYMLPWYNSSLMIISIGIVWIFTLLSLLNSSILSGMQACMKIEFSLISSVVWKLITLGLIALWVYVWYPKDMGSDMWQSFLWILGAWVVGVFCNLLLNWWYAQKIIVFRFLFDWKYIKYLFRISLPYGIALFLSVVYFKIDIILLSLLEDPQKSDISIALYSLPMKIVEVLMVIGWFFLNSLLPSLSKHFEEKKLYNLQKVLKNAFLVLFSFGICVIVFGGLFGKHILSLIAPNEYIYPWVYEYTSLDVFLIVIFILWFYSLALLFNYIFIASKNEKTLLYINGWITLFNIIGNIIFIPKYSFLWAAYVTLASQVLLCILWYILSRKIIKFSFWIWIMIWNILLWVLLYILWRYLLSIFDWSIYLEMGVIGGGLMSIYIWWIFLYFKIYKKYFMIINEDVSPSTQSLN